MATSFPPSSWPYPITYINTLTLDTSESGDTHKAYAVFPGRPYVVRGWLSTGSWEGLEVFVSTAEPIAETPFFSVDSMVALQPDPFTGAFETTFVTAGQCIVFTSTGGSDQILEISISAITSHE